MGSFTETVVAFEFAPDAPPEVIGVLSPWRVGDGPELPPMATFLTPPVLRRLERAVGDELDSDAFASLAASEKVFAWATYLGGMDNVYFAGYQFTQLVWTGRVWTLTSRFCHETDAAEMCAVLEPVGFFTCGGADADAPVFVGYVKNDTADRPVLVWHRGQGAIRVRGPRPHRVDGRIAAVPRRAANTRFAPEREHRSSATEQWACAAPH